MAIRTYKVTLDSKNTIAPEPVFLRQGDKTGAVVIDATLMDNGTPVSLSGLTPMFKANTADGQAVIVDGTGFNIVNASGGEFTYQVPNALSAVPGKITTAYFSFSDSSGSESTFDVAFVIKKAVDITQSQADNYITIVDGTIQSLQQKIDAMNTDVQTILNAFNQGDFYNKTQTDSKDADTLASAKSYADNIDDSLTTKINDNFNVLDRKINTLIPDTGWVKVAIINGWQGDISVRLQNGVIYHKGNFSATGATGAISTTVFKYPDSFGDMSSFNQLNGAWAAITADGYANHGFIKGATKEFFCWMKGSSAESSVSNIVFKL